MRFYGKHESNDTTACWIEQKIRTKNPIDLYSIHFFFLLPIGYFGLNMKKKNSQSIFAVQVEFLECLSCYYQSLAENLNTFHTSGNFLFILKYYAWNSVDNARAPLSLLFQFSIFWYFVRFFSFSGCICQVHRAIPDVTIGDINTLRLHVKAHLFYWNATASNGPDCWIVNNVMFFFTNQINMDNHFKCIFLLLAAILYTYILFYGIYARGGVFMCVCMLYFIWKEFLWFFFVCEKGYKTSK